MENKSVTIDTNGMGTRHMDELNSKVKHLPFVFALFKLEYIYQCGALGFRERKQNCNKDFGVAKIKHIELFSKLSSL